MKQKMFFAALLLWAASSVCAQTESRTTEERTDTDMRDEWFVSVAAGPQVLFSDHDKQIDFGDRISPALDIARLLVGVSKVQYLPLACRCIVRFDECILGL